ncbi:hypothetical protein Tco_1155584 [Tanacetum coccineum]
MSKAKPRSNVKMLVAWTTEVKRGWRVVILVRKGSDSFEDVKTLVVGCFFSCGVVVLLIAPLRGGHELKHNMIVLAKVRGDSKRGPEFTWERKDQMRSKCPQLFVDSANASSS